MGDRRHPTPVPIGAVKPDPPPAPPNKHDAADPAPNPTETLLRALVLAWDTDDEAAFSDTLAAARDHLGLPLEEPPAPPSREADVPLPYDESAF